MFCEFLFYKNQNEYVDDTFGLFRFLLRGEYVVDPDDFPHDWIDNIYRCGVVDVVVYSIFVIVFDDVSC